MQLPTFPMISGHCHWLDGDNDYDYIAQITDLTDLFMNSSPKFTGLSQPGDFAG